MDAQHAPLSAETSSVRASQTFNPHAQRLGVPALRGVFDELASLAAFGQQHKGGEGLEAKLGIEKDWPKVYLFKFIIPNDNQLLAQVESLFGPEAQVTLNQSRTGKYISVSAREMMISAKEVIERYENASKIEGVIAL